MLTDEEFFIESFVSDDGVTQNSVSYAEKVRAYRERIGLDSLDLARAVAEEIGVKALLAELEIIIQGLNLISPPEVRPQAYTLEDGTLPKIEDLPDDFVVKTLSTLLESIEKGNIRPSPRIHKVLSERLISQYVELVPLRNRMLNDFALSYSEWERDRSKVAFDNIKEALFWIKENYFDPSTLKTGLTWKEIERKTGLKNSAKAREGVFSSGVLKRIVGLFPEERVSIRSILTIRRGEVYYADEPSQPREILEMLDNYWHGGFAFSSLIWNLMESYKVTGKGRAAPRLDGPLGRKDKALTIERLASLSGGSFTVREIRNWRKGNVFPSNEQLMKLCDIFGFDEVSRKVVWGIVFKSVIDASVEAGEWKAVNARLLYGDLDELLKVDVINVQYQELARGGDPLNYHDFQLSFRQERGLVVSHKGIMGTDFAELLEVNPGAVGRWEGISIPSEEIQIKMPKAMAVLKPNHGVRKLRKVVNGTINHTRFEQSGDAEDFIDKFFKEKKPFGQLLMLVMDTYCVAGKKNQVFSWKDAAQRMVFARPLTIEKLEDITHSFGDKALARIRRGILNPSKENLDELSNVFGFTGEVRRKFQAIAIRTKLECSDKEETISGIVKQARDEGKKFDWIVTRIKETHCITEDGRIVSNKEAVEKADYARNLEHDDIAVRVGVTAEEIRYWRMKSRGRPTEEALGAFLDLFVIEGEDRDFVKGTTKTISKGITGPNSYNKGETARILQSIKEALGFSWPKFEEEMGLKVDALKAWRRQGVPPKHAKKVYDDLKALVEKNKPKLKDDEKVRGLEDAMSRFESLAEKSTYVYPQKETAELLKGLIVNLGLNRRKIERDNGLGRSTIITFTKRGIPVGRMSKLVPYLKEYASEVLEASGAGFADREVANRILGRLEEILGQARGDRPVGVSK